MAGKIGTTNYPSLSNILLRIPELDIFRKYLGKMVYEGESFTNPLREDNSPTCNFHRKADGRLRMKDHAGYFAGDCVDLVMVVNRVNYKKALRIIWDDFNAGTVTRVSGLTDAQLLQNSHVSTRAVFSVKRRAWDHDNLKFWSDYFIDQPLLEKFNVAPIEILWIGEGTYVQNETYRWDPNDPAYGYHLGKGEWKIYFPKRKHQRFFCNTNAVMGMNQLNTDSKFLVITKSLKDIMVLSMFDIPSIAPHSEGIVLHDIDKILNYFTEVFVLFDNDMPGKRGTLKYAHEGCTPLLIPNKLRLDYGIKDISDYIKFFKYTQTNDYINEIRRTQGY
jgi:hypothetical protein